MRFWWQKDLPANVVDYRDGTPRHIPGDEPLSDLIFVVLDSETTGFDLLKDRILSVATLEIRQGRMRVGEMGSWLIRQPNRSAGSSVSVHGILPSESASGEEEKDVLDQLLIRLRGAIIVGHHIGFDVAMLNAAMKRHYRTSLCNPVLDTGKLAMSALDAFARTGYPGQREPSLDEVCARVNIEPVERHTAEGDVFTTATLFLELCLNLRRRKKRALTAGDLPLK